MGSTHLKGSVVHRTTRHCVIPVSAAKCRFASSAPNINRAAHICLLCSWIAARASRQSLVPRRRLDRSPNHHYALASSEGPLESSLYLPVKRFLEKLGLE